MSIRTILFLPFAFVKQLSTVYCIINKKILFEIKKLFQTHKRLKAGLNQTEKHDVGRYLQRLEGK